MAWEYEYDELGRLTREARDADNNGSFSDPQDRDISYTYDADSNRTNETDNISGAVKLYSYEPGSHRLASIDKDGQPFQSFTWHPGGQLATKEDENGVVWTYTWSGERLVEVENDSGLKIDYAYDENDDLVRQTHYQDATLISDERYLVDRENRTGYSQIIATIDAETGTITGFHTFADQILAETKIAAGALSRSLLHADALGSIRQVESFASGGQVSETEYDYAAFGGSLGPVPNPSLYAFAGELRSTAAALQYHRARWLDVSIGRWLSFDPQFDYPMGLGNPYSYAGLRPTLNTDPSGLFTLAEAINVVSIIARLTFIAWTTYDLSRIWGDYAGGGGRSFANALGWTLFYIFGGAAIGKLLGLISRAVGPTVLIYGRPLLARFGELARRHAALRPGGGFSRAAEEFVTAFYQKLPFSRVPRGGIDDFVEKFTRETGRKRVPDVVSKWAWWRDQAIVEVKHWGDTTWEIFDRLRRNVAAGGRGPRWQQLRRQLDSDALAAQDVGVRKVIWHFTNVGPPDWFIREAGEIFAEHRVVLEIIDWSL